MLINSINSTYIQKSRLFLYPLLGIRRGGSITPVQTYMTWDEMYNVNSCKFIAVYHLRDDQEFKVFEEAALMGNMLFENFFELEDGKGAYVFDFTPHRKEYKKIMHGKYSLLDEDYKVKVLKFFKNYKKHHAYIESYLYPELYFSNYATLLRVKISLLKSVGQLCDLPDLTQEVLKTPVKILNLQTINNL